MSSLFNKFSILVKGTSHDILDKAIDLNSPSMLRQYARELEEQVEVLNGESATAAGSVRTATRELNAIQALIDNDLAAGTKLKASDLPNKDVLMAAKAADIVKQHQALAMKKQEVDSDTAAASQLDLVFGKVKAKSQEINARIKALESMDATSKAKAHAADVISQTASILGSTDTSSIDDLAQKIQAKSDVSDVKLDRALNGFNEANPDPDPVATSDVMAEF